MNMSLSRMIAIVCILAVGFIGLFPLAKSTEAHPSHKAYTHTDIDCYERNGTWMAFCKSFTRTTWVAVNPNPHHTAAGTHIPHNFQQNTHDYDSDTIVVSSCSQCD